MRVTVTPSLTPHLHIDVTNALTAAIAQELARAQGGNDVLNWLEAERLLRGLIASDRAMPHEPARATPAREQPVGPGAEPRPRRTRNAAPRVTIPSRLARRPGNESPIGAP